MKPEPSVAIGGVSLANSKVSLYGAREELIVNVNVLAVRSSAGVITIDEAGVCTVTVKGIDRPSRLRRTITSAGSSLRFSENTTVTRLAVRSYALLTTRSPQSTRKHASAGADSEPSLEIMRTRMAWWPDLPESGTR